MIVLIDKNGFVTGYQVFPDSTEAPHVTLDITASQADKIIGLHASDLSDIDAAIEKSGAVKAANEEAAIKYNRLESARRIRDESLRGLMHDFGDGRVMQTRPSDEPNILRAIEIMESENIESIDWVMADNVKAPVTSLELKEALHSARIKGLQIWNDYNP